MRKIIDYALAHGGRGRWMELALEWMQVSSEEEALELARRFVSEQGARAVYPGWLTSQESIDSTYAQAWWSWGASLRSAHTWVEEALGCAYKALPEGEREGLLRRFPGVRRGTMGPW